MEFRDVTDTACLKTWKAIAMQLFTTAIEGRTVAVVFDPVVGDRGPFGRLLAYVHIDGRDLNAALVRGGLARVRVRGETTRKREYLELQEAARAKRRGTWACDPNPA